MNVENKGWNDVGKGPEAKEYRQPLEAEKDRKWFSPQSLNFTQ